MSDDYSDLLMEALRTARQRAAQDGTGYRQEWFDRERIRNQQRGYTMMDESPPCQAFAVVAGDVVLIEGPPWRPNEITKAVLVRTR